MNRQIMHIDMDAFFAAVEQHDCPAYQGKPVIVGGDPHARGVVSTCSYEARQYGVHSAMPLREAFRRCPQGIFLPVRGARYAEVSRQIMAILAQYTPLVEPLSLDEAFLDLTGTTALFGPTEQLAKTILRRIEVETGLSASAGLAPNKFLAKLASELEKPQGFVVITPENILAVLEDLPVQRLWGVGPKSAAQLERLGIRTVGMLGRIDVTLLKAKLGQAGVELHRLALGQDERPVLPETEVKSIGHELTFQNDSADRDFLAGVLLWLAEQVARRLRLQQLRGRVITLKLRDYSFQTMTKRTTLAAATDFEEVIYREALQMAERLEWGAQKLRLVGVSISGFSSPPKVQMDLFAGPEPVMGELDRLHQAVDGLRDRFGEGIITKGTVLKIKERVRRGD